MKRFVRWVQYRRALRKIEKRPALWTLPFRVVKLIVFQLLIFALLCVVTPVLILREVRNIIAFVLFLIWRNHKANQIYMRHGWAAREYFLRAYPADYEKFCGG
jgi:hypothetical protein